MPLTTIEELGHIIEKLSKPDLCAEDLVPTQQINAVLWKLADRMEAAEDKQLPRQRLRAMKAKAKRRLKELNSDTLRGHAESSAIIRLSKINRELEDKLKIDA